MNFYYFEFFQLFIANFNDFSVNVKTKTKQQLQYTTLVTHHTFMKMVLSIFVSQS